MFLGKKKDASKAWSKAVGNDIRRFPRMGLKVIVEVRSLEKRAHCRLHDLSLGGLSFIAPWAAKIDDPVSVYIPPPRGLDTPVPIDMAGEEVEGRVCRDAKPFRGKGEYLVAVRFEGLSPTARDLIRFWFETFGETPERPIERPGKGASGSPANR